MKTFAALALLLLAAAVPSTSAQTPTGVTMTVGELAAPIPYEGAATLPIDVQVGCATILQSLADATLTVTPVAPPAWLAVAEASADLADPANVQACLAGASPGFMVQHFDLPLAVTKDAPGVVDHVVEFVATLGEDTHTAPATLTVAYNVNYTLVPDVTFPLMVNGTEVSFNVTVTQASNARSMVMIEQMKTTAGVFSGLGSQVYENEAGMPAGKTFKVTFKAPEGEWSNATTTFTAFGHYLLLDGRAGDFDAGTPVTYSFVAGHAEHDEEPDDKESPAPVGMLLALGLVALAAFVRRRA